MLVVVSGAFGIVEVVTGGGRGAAGKFQQIVSTLLHFISIKAKSDYTFDSVHLCNETATISYTECSYKPKHQGR